MSKTEKETLIAAAVTDKHGCLGVGSDHGEALKFLSDSRQAYKLIAYSQIDFMDHIDRWIMTNTGRIVTFKEACEIAHKLGFLKKLNMEINNYKEAGLSEQEMEDIYDNITSGDFVEILTWYRDIKKAQGFAKDHNAKLFQTLQPKHTRTLAEKFERIKGD